MEKFSIPYVRPNITIHTSGGKPNKESVGGVDTPSTLLPIFWLTVHTKGNTSFITVNTYHILNKEKYMHNGVCLHLYASV